MKSARLGTMGPLSPIRYPKAVAVDAARDRVVEAAIAFEASKSAVNGIRFRAAVRELNDLTAQAKEGSDGH